MREGTVPAGGGGQKRCPRSPWRPCRLSYFWPWRGRRRYRHLLIRPYASQTSCQQNAYYSGSVCVRICELSARPVCRWSLPTTDDPRLFRATQIECRMALSTGLSPVIIPFAEAILRWLSTYSFASHFLLLFLRRAASERPR